MAIYHYHAQVIGRKQGHSALAAAAYRAGVALADFDYSKRKASVDFAQIYAPENAPEWTQDRARLWQAVEDSEKRKDAQLCREINLALPVELTPAERQALVVEFVQSEFVSKGMIADLAIHHQNEANPHAHIMLTTRHIGPDGFGKKAREWNDRAVIQNTRKAWADIANVFLARAGHEARIDHRTLEAQGIDRPPQLHRGKTVTAMLRRGEQTRVTELEAIRQEQANLAKDEIALAGEFAELEKQERVLQIEEKWEIEQERKRQERIQSGAELADQIAVKKRELSTARRERDHAQDELASAIKKANAIANDIEEHNEEVGGQGFWGQLKNTFKNISNGRELNKTHRAAIQIATDAQTKFDEMKNAVAKLEADLATMETAFAKTPLGQQRKRDAELKAEQERQRAEQERKLAEQERKLAEQKKKEQEAERQKKIQEQNAQRQKQAPTISRGFGMGR